MTSALVRFEEEDDQGRLVTEGCRAEAAEGVCGKTKRLRTYPHSQRG